MQREVPVIEAGAVEKAAVRRAEPAERLGSESIRIEISMIVRAARIGKMKRADKVGCIDAASASKRPISGLGDQNREPRRKARDAINAPAFGEPPGQGRKRPVERERVIVTYDEVMRDVVGGKRAAEAVVHEIHPLSEARRVIHSFAVRVSCKKCQVRGAALQRRL